MAEETKGPPPKVTRYYGADGMSEEYEKMNPGEPVNFDQYMVSKEDFDEWKAKKSSGDKPLELLLIDQSRVPSPEEMKFITENLQHKIKFLKTEPVIRLYRALDLTVRGSDVPTVVDRMIAANDTFNKSKTLLNWLAYARIANAIIELYKIYDSAVSGMREQAFDEKGNPKVNVVRNMTTGYCEPVMSSTSFCLGVGKYVLFFSDQQKLITFVGFDGGTYCVVTEVLIGGHTLDKSKTEDVRRTHVYYSSENDGEPYLYSDYNSRRDLGVGCTHCNDSYYKLDSDECHKYFCDTIRNKGKLDKGYCPKNAWMYRSAEKIEK
ncbi:MAG: hypothetical protein Hyperionvirus4_136 [Hyperionvirus sp.]|uniref:Uncharacterized protein n=1 Tax=Hyperionvirus sp. TaxID=2487770 RepID=A0A3G5AAC8_9VIRU|nr:MAG: hypothetical protein Hyperionvirus4_136 [Hyperionvirus sp.]